MYSNAGKFYKQNVFIGNLILLINIIPLFNLDQTYDLKTEDIKYKTDIEIKPFNLYSSSNDPISMKENDNGT